MNASKWTEKTWFGRYNFAAIAMSVFVLAIGNEACTSDSFVVGGTCVTPFSACSQQCTDLSEDPRNCGACGKTCKADQSCVDGKCIRELKEESYGCQSLLSTASDLPAK